MKYRSTSLPKGIKPNSTFSRVDYKTLTYKLKVITPIYGGGVEAGKPDGDMPIRATAIRGQLRYWWRFLQMNHPEKPLQGEELFKEERRIWGGMTDDPDKGGSSNVFIAINIIQKTINKKKASEYKQNGIKYALFPAIQNKEDVLEPNIEFKLEVTTCNLDDKQHESIKEAIRWWICFGGIGARTRRGLGSVECIDSNFSPLQSDEVNKYGCELKILSANNAEDAWDTAVKLLHKFRQGGGIARNGNYGRSWWPEPDSIRQVVKRSTRGHEPRTNELPLPSFPRVAFGLPIIIDFVNDAPPDKTELVPMLNNNNTSDSRMASPLILKAMGIKNKYKSIALKMPTDHLNSLTIELKNLSGSNNRNLPKNFENGSWWSNSEEHANQVRPLRNRGTNALDAFMNFFEKGGK